MSMLRHGGFLSHRAIGIPVTMLVSIQKWPNKSNNLHTFAESHRARPTPPTPRRWRTSQRPAGDRNSSGVRRRTWALCRPWTVTHGWMDGWIDGWMDGWVGGWVDGWMDGWMEGWMDGWIDGWGWVFAFAMKLKVPTGHEFQRVSTT